MIFKNTVLLTVFLIITQILAILRERLFVNYVGIGEALDIYNAAFRLPDLMLGIMMAFVTGSAVIPFLYKYHNEKDVDKYHEYFSSLFIFFTVVMIIFSCILYVLMPYIMPLIVKGFRQEMLIEIVHYSRLLLLQPILLGLSYLLSAVAQSKNRFLLYGTAPIFYSLGIITTFYFFYDKIGMISAVYGVLIGALLQFSAQAIIMYKENLYPTIRNFKFKYIVEHMKVALPRSGSQIVSQFKLIYITYLASLLGAGAISALALAHKVFDVYVQIISSSLSTASLPRLSEYYADKNYTEFYKLFRKSFYFIAIVSILLASVSYIFSTMIVRFIFGNIVGIEIVVQFLNMLLIVLPIASLNWYMSIACNSRQETLKPFMSNILSLIVLVISGQYFYSNGYGILSLGYSTMLAFSISFIFLSMFMFSKEK